MKAHPVLLLSFDSIHDVLLAEKRLKEAGVACDLVPTPRDLSSDCGMSLKCDPAQQDIIENMRMQGDLPVRTMLPR